MAADGRAVAIPGVDGATDLADIAVAAADPEPARTTVCGSLYLTGTVLRKNG